jgi:hypothetical protein
VTHSLSLESMPRPLSERVLYPGEDFGKRLQGHQTSFATERRDVRRRCAREITIIQEQGFGSGRHRRPRARHSERPRRVQGPAEMASTALSYPEEPRGAAQILRGVGGFKLERAANAERSACLIGALRNLATVG